jgi:hypothetical protein
MLLSLRQRMNEKNVSFLLSSPEEKKRKKRQKKFL